MYKRGLSLVVAIFALVLLSYASASAQVVDRIKDAAGKTKDVTVKTAKKTTVVVTDALETAADKTKDATVKTAKVAGSQSKKFGDHTVNITENVAETTYEGGKWFTVTTWDGTKWVSKKVWYANKKAAKATKDAIVDDH